MKANDLTGIKVGRLTVMEMVEEGSRKKYKCRCECGEECIVRADRLKSGATLSCGCLRKERQSEANTKEISAGTVFGRFTVIENTGEKDSSGTYQYKCQCECGEKKIIPGTALRTGKVQSCGCLRKERQRQAVVKHGDYKSRLYKIWDGMIQRCTNPNNKKYQYYGGRGITVCAEWLNNYQSFRDWAIENGYDEKAEQWACTLDREDTNGEYGPNNCRWVPQSTQMNNTRRCRVVTVDGVSRNMTQWAQELGVHRSSLYRARRRGDDIENYIKAILMERRRQP